MVTRPRPPDVDLWTGRLDDPTDIDALRGVLSAVETARAVRFVQGVHRTRFTLRRAFRRVVLGHYTGLSAPELIFDEDGANKPTLSNDPGGGALHFSTSHSGHQWLMAVSGAVIGADIEAPREISDLNAMIGRVCSASEARLLSGLAPAARKDHFFTLWTVKEAVAKLTGEGLRAPLDAIDTGGITTPRRVTYHGQVISLSAPAMPGPAKAMLAAFAPVGRVRMRDVSVLLRPRSGENDPQATG